MTKQDLEEIRRDNEAQFQRMRAQNKEDFLKMSYCHSFVKFKNVMQINQKG